MGCPLSAEGFSGMSPGHNSYKPKGGNTLVSREANARPLSAIWTGPHPCSGGIRAFIDATGGGVMRLEKRQPSGREKDRPRSSCLEKLREQLYSSNISTVRQSAFHLSWMQEDGLDILREALLVSTSRRAKSAAAYGLRKMRGRMREEGGGDPGRRDRPLRPGHRRDQPQRPDRAQEGQRRRQTPRPAETPRQIRDS